MSNHPDLSHLPPPSGQHPPQPPPPGRMLSRLRTVGLIAVAVIVVLGAGVGIGLFAFNPQPADKTPVAESTGTPKAQPSEQAPSPSDDLVNEDTEAAPSPGETGECPVDAPDELVSGETQEYKVKLCLYEGAASADHVTYVGGNSENGFTVLPADMNFDSMGNPYLEASSGGIRYVVDPKGLYVEGSEVIVDQEWIRGNMQELYDFATG